MLVHSDGNNPPDNVTSFNYEFHITNVVGSSSLEFLETQSSDETSEANYIFAADSGLFQSARNGGASDQIVGGDTTLSGGDVTLTGTNRLLVRLDVEHVLGGGQSPADANGDQFTIELIEAETFFMNSGFGFPAYSSSDGTVTAQIPEPGTFLMGGLLTGVACFYRRRRRRQRQQAV